LGRDHQGRDHDPRELGDHVPGDRPDLGLTGRLDYILPEIKHILRAIDSAMPNGAAYDRGCSRRSGLGGTGVDRPALGAGPPRGLALKILYRYWHAQVSCINAS
jgi:hypothetical protein